jgi:hypothetical protein
MLVIGIGYGHIRSGLNVLDARIDRLIRRSRSARQGLLQRKA